MTILLRGLLLLVLMFVGSNGQGLDAFVPCHCCSAEPHSERGDEGSAPACALECCGCLVSAAVIPADSPMAPPEERLRDYVNDSQCFTADQPFSTPFVPPRA